VINPLADDADTIVTELANTFCANFSAGADDAKGQMVSKNLVMKGWRLHSKLRQSATQLRLLATALHVIIALLMFGSTVLAVAIVHIRLTKNHLQEEMLSGYKPSQQEEKHTPWSLTAMGETFSFWMLMLPISAGLLITLQSHFQFAEKWAGVHLAEQQVVAEIYTFLGNCGRYTGGAVLNRHNLLKRLQGIVTNLSASGIQEKDFLSSDDGDDFTSDSKALAIHINRSLYGLQPQSWLRRKCHEALMCLGLAAMEADGPPDRDPTLAVTTEVFMETRVIPLMKYYDGYARSFSRLRTALVLAVFTLLGSGFFLTAFGYLLWIPITVGMATLLTTFMHWMTPPESITALNCAISALHHLDLRWHGSSTKEQRSEAMHKRVVTVTEKVALAVGTAISQAPLIYEDMSLEEDWDTSADAEISNSKNLSVFASNSRSRSNSNPGTPGGRKGYSWTRQSSTRSRSGQTTPGGGRMF
jgi:hypothetical protein